MAAYLFHDTPRQVRRADVRITDRPFGGEDDWWRVRELLLDTVPLALPGFNWDVRRWEGSRYHNADLMFDTPFWQSIHLWETAAGKMVGVAHTDGPGDAALQVHPDYRALVEDAMIDWTEAHVRTAYEDDPARQRTDYYVFDYDAPRRLRLEARGFEQLPYHGVMRRMRIGPLLPPTPSLAAGYTLRTTDPHNLDDCQRIADVLNAAFERDFHSAPEVHNFVTRAPCYRADLDLMALAPDGTTLAAYVGVLYHPDVRLGVFEPVCTHPEHQRKGLARALMLEGLHRLRALGATAVTVETGSRVPANRLYQAVGFTEEFTGHVWRKVH